MPLLEVRQAVKRYRAGAAALDGVDLGVDAGEVVCLHGRSGAGKSTLLYVLGGLLRPTSGRYTCDGFYVWAASPRRRTKWRRENVGFVFQLFHLAPYLTARANVLSTARGGADDAGRADELLERFGLSSLARRKPSQLSAGEQQRVALVRAVLARPRLILADEPTGNLDPESSAAVFHALRGFADEGAAVVLASHDEPPAGVADRIVTMSDGKIAAQSTGTS